MIQCQKRNGTWYARMSWYGPNGDRHFKSKQGFQTKRQAQSWIHEMEVAKDHNEVSYRNPLFSKYFKEWAETYKIPKTSANTHNRYRHIYGKIVEYFGQVKIGKVTRRQYQQFINDYGANHSRSTMQKVHGTIRSCITDAMSEGIINRNFTDMINLVWNEANTRTIEYLNVAEIKDLISKLETDIKPTYVSRYLIIAAIYTGMRFGELLALTWSDIDFTKHTIKISKSYDYAGHQTKEPKTKSSNRVIRASESLLVVLNALRDNHTTRVFATKDDDYITSTAVNKTLRKYVHKKGYHFHSLRHSHVALLLYEGVPLYAISKRLGHSDMSITARKYAYLIDELKQQSDDKIEAILNRI